jgi:hypothetical protein
MRRYVECLSEEPQKMITRKTGVAGYLIEIQGQIVAAIDELPRAAESLVNIWSAELCFVSWYSIIHRSAPSFL